MKTTRLFTTERTDVYLLTPNFAEALQRFLLRNKVRLMSLYILTITSLLNKFTGKLRLL